MAENKTKPTEASPELYIAAIEDEARCKDCQKLAQLMAKATKQKAKMWGTSIVGFGTHKYQLAGGRESEICAVGFSSRKGDIQPTESQARRPFGAARKARQTQAREGLLVHPKLAEVDLKVLEQLVSNAVKAKQAKRVLENNLSLRMRNRSPQTCRAVRALGDTARFADVFSRRS